MLSPADLKPAPLGEGDVRLARLEACPVELYRRLYQEVGRSYLWVDRLGWSDEDVASHVARPDISLWVLYEKGELAGYFELRRHEDGSIEVAYFGLLPAFIGRGLGKYLLTAAVERAWAAGARRVWLHTASVDHPAALPNYLKRGFTPYKSEQYLLDT